MSNIVVQEQNQNSFLSIIDKVASSPNPNVDMLDRLLDAQERIMNKQAEMAFNRDLAVMLNKIPIIAKTSDVRVQTKTGASYGYKYASLDEIVEVVRPIMSEFGFSVNFGHDQPSQNSVIITCFLRHRDGHLITNSLTLPIEMSRQSDGNGKVTVQSVGATVSYGKRYTLCSILNIATGDDRDGYTVKAEQANQKMSITDERFDKAIEAVKGGKYKLYDLVNGYALTNDQKIKLDLEFKEDAK